MYSARILEGAARAINDAGASAGTVRTGSETSPAFFDTAGKASVLDINTNIDNYDAAGRAINKLNHVAGKLDRAMLWADGQCFELQPSDPRGYAYNANAIDDADVVYGCENVPLSATSSTFISRPVLWRDRAQAETIPGTPEGAAGCAFGVNALGHATGSLTLDKLSRAVIWRDGTLLSLEVPGGFSSCIGHGINDYDQVVGACINAASGGPRPFLWRDGQAIDLGTLSGETGIAYAINNAGEVVGDAPSSFVLRTASCTTWGSCSAPSPRPRRTASTRPARSSRIRASC